MPSIFARLPAELWIPIAAELPLASVAALSLTNHDMMSCLEDLLHPLTELRKPENRRERANLLQLFQPDYPRQTICHACLKFHPRTAIDVKILDLPLFGPRTMSTSGFVCPVWQKTFHRPLRHSQFNWFQLHDVKKGQTLGPDYGDPHALDYDKKETSIPMPAEAPQGDSRAIVVGGRLLLRERMYHALPPYTENGFFKLGSAYCQSFGPCPSNHIVNRLCAIGQKINLAIWRAHHAISTKEKGGGVFKTHPAPCSHCRAEYIFEIVPPDHYQSPAARDKRHFPYIMVLTRYIDFGDCKSPDSSDLPWLVTEEVRPSEKRHIESLSAQFETVSVSEAIMSRAYYSGLRLV